MPQLVVRAWGIVVNLTWGIVDCVIDAEKNSTNGTEELELSSNLENKVLNIYRGSVATYTSRSLI